MDILCAGCWVLYADEKLDENNISWRLQTPSLDLVKKQDKAAPYNKELSS